MILTMIVGIWSYQRLSRNEDPPFTIKTMASVFWPGASTSEEVNLLIEKLEKKLLETPYLDHTQSYSRAGQSVISSGEAAVDQGVLLGQARQPRRRSGRRHGSDPGTELDHRDGYGAAACVACYYLAITAESLVFTALFQSAPGLALRYNLI